MSSRISELEIDDVRDLLRRMVGRRVVVIGDAMLDRYLIGGSTGISPEAPVPVVSVEREEQLLGGAANVAKCLVALGAKVKLVSVIGKDAEGDVFLEEARGLRIDVSGVLRDATRPTTLKSRVVAQNQQMLRLDWETKTAISPALEKRLIARIGKDVRDTDAVVLSDYSKGVLTPAVCRAAIRSAGRRPVIVDPKEGPWERFRGATVLKPNRRDVRRIMGAAITSVSDVEAVGGALIRDLKLKHVVVTRSEEGLVLASRNGGKGIRGKRSKPRTSISWLPAWQREVYDSTGAGDAISATLGLAMAAGAGIEASTWLANVAAGVEVGKFGTAVVSDQEILEAVGGGEPDCERKVMSRAQTAALVKQLRRQGKRVVFTNGCFDILHYGHVSYLERSRKLGDALVVGVNSDASVRRVKGSGRPVQNEHDRTRILAAQACVDAVVLFDEETPIPLLKAIRPDVLCKGGDYKSKREIVGWDIIEGWGGRAQLVQGEEGLSTTNLLKKAKG